MLVSFPRLGPETGEYQCEVELGLPLGVSFGYGTNGTQKTPDRMCSLDAGPLFDTRHRSALGCDFAM